MGNPEATHGFDEKERIEVEEHDLSEGTFIETRYMGTDADRHDMIMLGRKQVLRVCPPQSQGLRKFAKTIPEGPCPLPTDHSLLSAISSFCPWWALLPSSFVPGNFCSRTLLAVWQQYIGWKITDTILR